MALEVQVQRWLPFETLAADVADERFLDRVYPVVVGEVRLGPKGLVAHVARVRPLVGVASHVRLQVAFVGKGFGALRTDKGLFSGVNAPVPLQFTSDREFFVAEFATEITVVQPFVQGHRPLRGKAQGADVAGKRTDVRVRRHVHLEI